MIIPMKRLTLIGLKTEQEPIMKKLQSIGAVQVLQLVEAAQNTGSLSGADQEAQRLSNAFSIIKPYAKKRSMLEEKPSATLKDLLSSKNKALKASKSIEEADSKKTALLSQIEKNNALIEALTPWENLKTDLNKVQPTSSTALFCGMLKNEDGDKLNNLPEDTAIQLFKGEKETAVIILSHIENEESTLALLKEISFEDAALPNMPYKAKDVIKKAKKETESLKKDIEKLEEALAKLAEERDVIASALDFAAIERDRAVASGSLFETKEAFMLEGWVREDEQELVKKCVEEITDACVVEFKDPEEGESIPTAIKNKKLVEPYEAVTNLYSQPAVGSIDGTPFMAPFYFLLFGIMLSDTGYGIILALGCLFFLLKTKPAGMAGNLVKVIMWGGVSTIVWGFLVGTFFGMDWNMLLYGTPEGPFPLIVNPNTDPISMLILCFGLGIIHILYGVGIKMYMCFRDKDWKTAIFDNFSWMLIVVGLIIFAAAPAIKIAGMAMALLGGAMVLFMKGREKKNIVSRAVSGLAGLYDITAYLSDILSYARLFALGIATGVIGSVFNSLASMVMAAMPGTIGRIIGILIGIAMLVALHMFNIAINTLGTFVHCARLQYVEFYGKFYEVGGKEFKPLGYKTKHTRVLL